MGNQTFVDPTRKGAKLTLSWEGDPPTEDELNNLFEAKYGPLDQAQASPVSEGKNQYLDILGNAVRESVQAIPAFNPIHASEALSRPVPMNAQGEDIGTIMNRGMGVPNNPLMSQLSLNPFAQVGEMAIREPEQFKSIPQRGISEQANQFTTPMNYMIPHAIEAGLAASELIPVGKATLGELLKIPVNRIKDAIKGDVAPEVVDRFIQRLNWAKKYAKHLPEKMKNQKFESEAPPPETAPVPQNEVMDQPVVNIPGQEVVKPNLQEKFLGEVKAAKPVRREQEALYRKERTERFGRAEGASKTNRGQAGFEAEKSFLKGELPKSEFESISSRFSQEEIDSLLDMIKNSSKLEYIETVTGRNSLLKMIQGKVPTEGELALLKKVFGEKLESVLTGKLPLIDRLWKYLIKTGNMSRGMMASFDMSMPFRQGIFLISKPKEFIPAFKEMFKYFMSEKALDQFQSQLKMRPTYPLMKQAKLALTEMDGILLKQEEQFMQANLAENIPVIGKVVRASNRAAVGFLNKLRADVFDSLINQARKEGLSVDDNLPLIKSVADFINSATGRGNIKGMEQAIPVMNSLFFSPRLMMSRFNLLNPIYYMKLEPFARKEALKTLAGTAAILSTINYMAKMAGAQTETNPTATDFGKIKIGNTRYDIGGGFLQWIRLYSQLISGTQKTSTGKEIKFGEGYKPTTRLDVLSRFAEYKTAPILSLGISLLRGKDSIGNEVNIKTLPTDIMKRYIPLVLQDLKELYKERGIEGLPMGIPAFFGIGTMTYNSNKKAKK